MSIALVVGGTGTLGQEFVPIIASHFERVRVLSRSEHPQIRMEQKLGLKNVDYLMGDIRDPNRMIEACKDVEAVFHFAATKSVDKVEYDPYEAVLTNIVGTHNVIKACQKQGVSRAIFTSTDKAVAPLNQYGASKLCAEKLWIAGNVGSYLTRFSAVRYGNVFGSNGSVIQKWKTSTNYKITDPLMTRFFMKIERAANFVFDSYKLMQGGEIFIPKMKSCSIGELFDVVVPNAGAQDVDIVGLRPGEKMHETLITEEECRLVTETPHAFIRWPSHKLFPFKRIGIPMHTVTGGYTSENAIRFEKIEIEELCQSLC